MIEDLWTKKENGYFRCRSTGRACCSSDYEEDDKDKIIQEAKDNVAVAMRVCKWARIDFEEFIKDISPKRKNTISDEGK